MHPPPRGCTQRETLPPGRPLFVLAGFFLSNIMASSPSPCNVYFYWSDISKTLPTLPIHSTDASSLQNALNTNLNWYYTNTNGTLSDSGRGGRATSVTWEPVDGITWHSNPVPFDPKSGKCSIVISLYNTGSPVQSSHIIVNRIRLTFIGPKLSSDPEPNDIYGYYSYKPKKDVDNILFTYTSGQPGTGVMMADMSLANLVTIPERFWYTMAFHDYSSLELPLPSCLICSADSIPTFTSGEGFTNVIIPKTKKQTPPPAISFITSFFLNDQQVRHPMVLALYTDTTFPKCKHPSTTSFLTFQYINMKISGQLCYNPHGPVPPPPPTTPPAGPPPLGPRTPPAIPPPPPPPPPPPSTPLPPYHTHILFPIGVFLIVFVILYSLTRRQYKKARKMHSRSHSIRKI